jgi:DNA-binding Lrp family transcriptional regulator
MGSRSQLLNDFQSNRGLSSRPPIPMETLISLLRKNARASIEDLAKTLNLTPAEVAQQIATLESDGIILSYQAVVDPERAASRPVTACIEVSITPERGGGFDRLATRIARFTEVKSCYLMSGGYDLLVVVEGDTLQDVASFISEKLSTIKGVISTATRFRLKAYKENGVSLFREESPKRLAVAP